MKLGRAYEKDLVVLEEMHQYHAFDHETFVARYIDEMSSAVADPGVHRSKFLLGIKTIFGVDVAEQTRDRLERVPAQKEFLASLPLRNRRFLHGCGLRSETVDDARFADAIRQDVSGAIIFPFRDRQGDVVGLQVRDENLERFVGSREAGLWTSRPMDKDKCLVLSTDPLDVLAYHQEHPAGQTRYLALGHAISQAQRELVRSAGKAPGQRSTARIVCAFASDPEGDKLATQVTKLFVGRHVEVAKPPQEQSWSRWVAAKERDWIRQFTDRDRGLGR